MSVKYLTMIRRILKMSVMNGIENVAIAGAAVAGTTILLGKASEMESGSLKEIGGKISDTVETVGNKLGGALSNLFDKADEKGGFLMAVKDKIDEHPKLAKVVAGLATGGTFVSANFDKVWDKVVDAKEQSEANGSSFAGNLGNSLMGAVSNTANYVVEKVKDEIGLGGAEKADEEPAFEAVQADAENDFEADFT